MKKKVEFMWDEKCQEAFDAIKRYLMNPPMIIPPCMDVPFYLYIFAMDFALGFLLAQQNKLKKE